MKNVLKEKLANGGKPIGTFFELGSPSVVEALGRTGLDFVILDNEHGPVLLRRKARGILSVRLKTAGSALWRACAKAAVRLC